MGDFNCTPATLPKISVWITSVGRCMFLQQTLESFVQHNTYQNYEIIIVESQMTPESTFISGVNRDQAKTEFYLKNYVAEHPELPITLYIQPWMKLGKVYNQLLDASSGEYYFNLEDDLVTVCDPAPQFIESIHLFRNDPKLYAIRYDLRDESVYDGCSRLPITKCVDGIKYVVWSICSGGAQLVDISKVKQAGRFDDTHENSVYGQPERTQMAQMRAQDMYVGVNLNWWGTLKHIGAQSIQNEPREWSTQGYERLYRSNFYGDLPRTE